MTAVVGEGSFTYQVDPTWEQLPAGWSHPDVASIAVDDQDRVFVFNRGEHPVIIYDRNGTFLDAWGEGEFSNAHGIAIAPDGTAYCGDKEAHAVKRFTPDGRLLEVLGTPGVPSDTGVVDDFLTIKQGGPPFNGPTDIDFGPTGDVYVSDGYWNARVHCFASNGRLRFSWGQPGTGKGEFNIPHALAVAADGRVLVADRENDRIQIFSPEGVYLDEWTDLTRPDDLTIGPDGHVYVVELGRYVGRWPSTPPDTPDSPPSRLSVFDLEGNLLARWGTRAACAPASFFAPHGIAVDSRGDIYVGEANWSGGGKDGDVPPDCHTLQKFVRR